MRVTITIRAEGDYATHLIEAVFTPAARDMECKVHWPNYPEPEFQVEFDTKELWRLTHGAIPDDPS